MPTQELVFDLCPQRSAARLEEGRRRRRVEGAEGAEGFIYFGLARMPKPPPSESKLWEFSINGERSQLLSLPAPATQPVHHNCKDLMAHFIPTAQTLGCSPK